MEIEAELAQTIAQEVSHSTHHNINFFDTSGHCIASTDPSRIGSFHEAAFLAANRRVTVEVDDSKQYIGARNGINVPVSFQGQVVAVIGITGRKQDVKPFGDVLRRMTEILLQENFERTTRFDKSMTMANLVTLLLTDQSDPSMLSYLSSALNVDLAQDHICLVAAFDGKDHSYQDRASLLNDMNAFLERQASGSFFSLRPQTATFFIPLASIGSGQDSILQLADRLAVPLSHHVKSFFIGISDPFHPGDQAEGQAEGFPAAYQTAFRQASMAADSASRRMTGTYLTFDSLDIDILLRSSKEEDRRVFLSHVLGDMTDEEIRQASDLFLTYTACNGSIIRTARELFLHKNTVQNRLNKITDLTGYNPRDLKDHTVLALAFAIQRAYGYTGN